MRVFFTAKLLLNLEFVRYCIYCDFFPLKLSLPIVITHASYTFIVMYLFLINDMFIYIMIFSVQKAIDDVQVTANYDKPVGMFDGLIQTMVCGVGIHKLISLYL